MNTYTLYLILLAGGLSLLVHFLVIDVTHKKGIFMDSLDKIQKAHSIPTPRIGGLGIFLACMLIINDSVLGTSLMLASIPAFISGFLEDYSGRVAPLQRLGIMLLSPVLCIIFMPASTLTQAFGADIPIVLSAAFTILISLAMVNGVNFIDGQNGLASGSILITQAAILVMGIMYQDTSVIYISAIILISTFTFMLFNYPFAKIFLGDGGAYFLGFITAILVICLYSQHTQHISFLLIPALLIYPLWEVVFSIIRKMFFDKISPLQSDKYHLHQLIFRNQAQSRHYIPSLIILPMQLVIAVLAIWKAGSTGMLAMLILTYCAAYTVLYIYTKRLDMIKRAQVLSKSNR